MLDRHRGGDGAGRPGADDAVTMGAVLPLTRIADAPTEATFLERPHRFAVVCRLENGQIVEAHLPDPGRLTGTLSKGRAVLLDGPYPEGKRKLRWTCLAVRTPRAWVGTVTTLVNRAFPLLLDAGHFPELGEVVEQRAEVKEGDSRFDWELRGADGRRTLVECKCVTLARGTRAMFPDAVTTRGTKHLRGLTALADGGERCAVVFIAQRGDVRSFEAAREVDPTFADALDVARRSGVQILAVGMRVSRGGLSHPRRLELRWA